MKAEFINPFLQSMSNVLSMMASMELKPEKPSVKHDHFALGDITGIIGMNGPNIKGSMAVSFKKAVIFEIVKRMLGDKVDTLESDTVSDMVGELTNMVTGGAKKLLAEKGHDIGMATPVVVLGERHKVKHLCKGTQIVIPFDTEVGEIYVEICFESSK